VRQCIRYRAKGRIGYLSISISVAFASFLRIFSYGIQDKIGITCFIIGMIVIVATLLIPSKGEIPDREYAIKHSKIVWAFWFSGGRHLELIRKYNSVKRILLMEPDSPAFKANLQISGYDKAAAKDEIKKLTQLAINKGIGVKWYKSPRYINSSLTIYDPSEGEEPSSSKAYYVLSTLEKDVPRSKRALFVIRRKDDENEFKNQIKKFKDIWDNFSRQPRPEEYSDTTTP
jgi:hypothetical protein